MAQKTPNKQLLLDNMNMFYNPSVDTMDQEKMLQGKKKYEIK